MTLPPIRHNIREPSVHLLTGERQHWLGRTGTKNEGRARAGDGDIRSERKHEGQIQLHSAHVLLNFKVLKTFRPWTEYGTLPSVCIDNTSLMRTQHQSTPPSITGPQKRDRVDLIER